MCQLSLSSPSFPLLNPAPPSVSANGTISLKAQPWSWPIVQHIPRTFQYHQHPQHGTIIPRTRLLGVSEMALWFFFENPAKPGKTLCVRFPYLSYSKKRIRESISSMTSMLLALLTAPALLATNEAIRQGQTKDRREEHRARRSNLIISCVAPSSRSFEIDHRQVALKNNKVPPSPIPPGY